MQNFGCSVETVVASESPKKGSLILEKDQEDGTRKFTLKMGGTTIAELGSDIENHASDEVAG